VLALAVFWLLGRSGSFDASAKLVAIEHAFHITAVLFLPLVLVVAAIFLAALVGGCLAMAVAPERVVAFSAAGEALPRWLALIRGVWLALANGYQAEHGGAAAIDQLASRGGLSGMLDAIWLVIAAARFSAALVASLVSVASLVFAVLGHSHCRSIYRDCTARTHVQSGFRETPARSGCSVADDRCLGHSHFGAHCLEQLRGLYASHAWRATLGYLPYAVFDVTSPLLAIAAAGSRIPRRGKAAQAPYSGGAGATRARHRESSQLNEPVCCRAFPGRGLSRMQWRAQALLLLV
jgi:Na+:H+ antiporter, NhaC family